MSQNLCPPDILLLVSSHLDPKSKQQLCLVSQYFHSIFAPVVLHNVRVLFCEENSGPASIDERLKTCSSNLSNVYKYARSLRVNTHGYYVHRHVTSSLLPALWETIARLTSVRSLELEWERHDNNEKLETIAEYQEHVVTSLLKATGNRLDRLVLKPASGSPSLPAELQRIRGLKSLRITSDEHGWTCSYYWFGSDEETDQTCNCYRPWMKDVIKPLISANPGLETLEIIQGCKHQGPSPDDILPESLTNLTSLTISGLNIPSIQTDGAPLVHVSPLRNLRHLTVRTPHINPKLDAFWDAMRAAKPPLEIISSYQVSRSMVNYLASFSGLRALEITQIRETEGCNSFDLASSFLKNALPRHADSLEGLIIGYDRDIYTIPGWDFDSINWPTALSQFSGLQYLSLFPPVPDSTVAYKMTAPQLSTAYQTVLDTMVDLPSLLGLKIDFPQPTFSCGTGYREWSTDVCKTLNEVVPKLRMSGGKPKILELHNGTYYCVQLDGEDGDVWGYDAKKVVNGVNQCIDD